MIVEEVYSYCNLQHEWVSKLTTCIEEIPENIFFEQYGDPLRREVRQLDNLLFECLTVEYGQGVKHNFRPMVAENQFEIDIVLPTEPKTLIEIEKGKQPRLELDIMKIVNTIWRYPSEYGYGCIIVPTNYVELNLAGNRPPYQYMRNQLIPLNRPILDFKNQGGYLIRDFVIIGYVDPRG